MSKFYVWIYVIPVSTAVLMMAALFSFFSMMNAVVPSSVAASYQDDFRGAVTTQAEGIVTTHDVSLSDAVFALYNQEGVPVRSVLATENAISLQYPAPNGNLLCTTYFVSPSPSQNVHSVGTSACESRLVEQAFERDNNAFVDTFTRLPDEWLPAR